MLARFLSDCAADSMRSILMTTTVIIRGRSLRCQRDTSQRSGRYEDGGLASIGNCYLAALTCDVKAISTDPTDLLGEVATMDAIGWRIFGVQVGDAVTTLTVQRDTEAG